MLRLAFKETEADFEFTQWAGLKELMFDRFDFLTRQGDKAFRNDIMLISQDWSEMMEQVSCPVKIAHGVLDKVVLIDGVRGFAAKHDQCELFEVNGAGQLVLNQEPELVFGALAGILKN